MVGHKLIKDNDDIRRIDFHGVYFEENTREYQGLLGEVLSKILLIIQK